MASRDREGAAAARQADLLDDVGDGADVGVVAAVAGDQEDALLVADVDRQGHVHVGENDDLVEGDQPQFGHAVEGKIGP